MKLWDTRYQNKPIYSEKLKDYRIQDLVINKFDNSDWTWAKLCEYFNYSDREIEALFGIMKSCTFDELCKGLRDRDNEDKEKKTFEELKLAYETLIKKETREEYDNYLDSLSANMEHEEELSEEDPDEK